MSQNKINLVPSKILSDSGILHEFYIDVDDKCIKLRLNKIYNPTIAVDIELDVIKKKGWKEFANQFRIELKPYKIDKDHENWIVSNVTDNGELIRSVAKSSNNNNSSNGQQTQEQEQERQNEGDEGDTTKTDQEKIIEKLSVSEAIRKKPGTYAVTGTIIGVSILTKPISKISKYCEKCAFLEEITYSIPIPNVKGIKENCRICGKHIQFYNIKALEYRDMVVIELQNNESFNDLDKLNVSVFDEDTLNIGVGETVECIGQLEIVERMFNNLPHFYCESLKYLNKENYALTESDIQQIQEFNEIYKDKEGGVIKALVDIFDLSIIDCDVQKEGILYSAANTSPKIGKKSEHLDILMIGPPGLGKTELLGRSVELVPGSNKVGGLYATGKSFTAIVEKTENNTFLRLGSIPRSYNAICGINELNKLPNQDLDKLYDVMAERKFDFEKHGIKANIKTPTAIISTANPENSDNWINNEKIDWNELPGLAPLKDRWGLIFIFRKRSQKENADFTDKWSEVQAKKERGELPDYTEFIIKYLQYAKTLQPVLSDEARHMLKEFYKEVNATGFGSPRVLNVLNNLAKAIARLKLKNVVDEEDAQETQEFYNTTMLQNFQKSVVYSRPPKYLAYDKGKEILEGNKNFNGIRLEELAELICKDNKQLASYFRYDEGKSLKIKHNYKIQELRDLLINNSHIKQISDSPIVLKWFDLCDPCDVCDPKINPDQEKNKKNNEKNNNFSGNESETISHRSHRSHSNNEEPESELEKEEESIKGFRMSPKGKIHETTEERYRELTGQEEEGEDQQD